MPWALVALAALQVGASFMQQRDARRAARRAGEQAASEATENQNRLVREAQKQRREAQGAFGWSMLGIQPTPSQQVSQQGGILTQREPAQRRSLLGG